MTTQITKQIRINAPIEQVWDVVRDFGNINAFNPNLTNSYSTSENNEGLGATRHCDLLPMGSIEERVIDWQDGVGYTIEIFDGEKQPPYKNAQGTFHLRGDGNQTIVTFSLQYEMKLGPIGALMNRVMLRSQFDKAALNIAQGLKHYIEVGEKATPKTLRVAYAGA